MICHDIDNYSYIELAALYKRWEIVAKLSETFNITELVFRLAKENNQINIIKKGIEQGHIITKSTIEYPTASLQLIKLCINYGIFPTITTLNNALLKQTIDMEIIKICLKYSVKPNEESLNLVVMMKNIRLFELFTTEYKIKPTKNTMKYAIIGGDNWIIDKIEELGIELKPNEASYLHPLIDRFINKITSVSFS